MNVLCWLKIRWRMLLCFALLFLAIAFLIVPTSTSLAFWDHLSNKSGALADWVAAFAAVALVYGLLLTKQSLKESTQSATFQRVYEQFNAPNMLHARAVLAKTHRERVKKGGIDSIIDNYVPDQGWLVVYFLNSVGYLVDTDQLRLEDVLFAYGHHIQLVCARWKHILSHECQEDRYKPLLGLCARIEVHPQRTVRNEIERDWEPAQEGFWESEACLDANAKSEG
jgi:hypothetical protein